MPYQFNFEAPGFAPEDYSTFHALIGEEFPMESIPLGSIDNTEPTKDQAYIPRLLIQDWQESHDDPFPDFEGMEAYAQEDPKVWGALLERIKGNEYVNILSSPNWVLVDELTAEGNLRSHFDVVNFALWKTSPPERRVMIQAGKAATEGNQTTDANQKCISSIPDKSSFFVNNEGRFVASAVQLIDPKQHSYENAKQHRNVIPGEVKLSHKFRRDFLDAVDEAGAQKEKLRVEARKVLTQIYQYMNDRHCKYGYLLTDYETICIRRTGTSRHNLEYGVLDISQSLPLITPQDSRIANAKFGLWYLHHKYLVTDETRGYLKKTRKPPGWRNLAKAVQRLTDYPDRSPVTPRRSPRRGAEIAAGSTSVNGRG
jgi:hypothetical protein